MVLLLTDREKADLNHAKSTMVDFNRMKMGGQLAQFFAVFLPAPGMLAPFHIPEISDEVYIQTLRGYLLKNVEAHSDSIRMAYHAEDILTNRAQGKMSAILTMEDGRAAEGNHQALP